MATGIALAVAGFGYWALVAATLAGPGVMTVLAWTTTRWIPGRPHRDAEILSMLRFGGVVTIQSVLNYGAQNIDKVLLGRFRGVDALGIYGRAYQLVAMPMTESERCSWVGRLLRAVPDSGRSSTVPKLLPEGLQRRRLAWSCRSSSLRRYSPTTLSALSSALNGPTCPDLPAAGAGGAGRGSHRAPPFTGCSIRSGWWGVPSGSRVHPPV